MVFKLGLLVVMITLASCVAHRGYSYERPNKHLSYDWRYDYEDQWSNGNGIPGVVGKDYPIFHQVPWTRFGCEWKYPGYYADPEANCQAYHICQRGARKDSFLCPNGTLFNQERLVCTWWYTVDCSRAQSFYSINEAVAKAMEEADRRIRIAGGHKLSWNYQRESNENRSWNKNWRSEQRWNKDSTPIRHNQDFGFLKRLPSETPTNCSKFFDKPLPEPNYKSEFGKRPASQYQSPFYLPV